MSNFATLLLLNTIAMLLTLNSRCFTLDVAGSSKEAITRKITDENGNPVNISKVTIVLENSDVKCLQGWSYSFKNDTVFMSNQCPVRFEICYESGAPTTIAPNSTDPPIFCQQLNIKCGKKEHKTKTILDRNKNPVKIRSVTIVKQLTKIACEEGKNYFFNGSNIYVQNGCGAKFNICYPVVTEVVTPSPSTASPGDKTPRSPSTASPGDKTPPSPSTASPGDKTPPSPSTASPGDKTPPSPSTASPGDKTPPSPSTASPGDKTPPSPSTASPGDKTPPSPSTASPGDKTPPSPSTASPGDKTPPSPSTASPGDKTPIRSERGACVIVALFSTSDSPAEKKSVDAQGSPLRVRSMDLQERYSKEKCLPGKSFSFTGSVVQATAGCRATFKVCYEGIQVTTPATPVKAEPGACVVVDLSSTSDSLAEKTSVDSEGSPLDVRSMDLQLEHSKGKCVPGKSFSFTGSVVQASAGCKATFRVCYEGVLQVTTPTTTVTGPQQITTRMTPIKGIHTSCEIVELSSESRTVTEKVMQDAQGRPVIVTSLEVVNWYSPSCRSGETYTFSGSVVRVSGGCTGNFKVCYLNNTSPQLATTARVPINEPICLKVTLLSTENDTVIHTIFSKYHNTLQVVSVELVKQLSTVQCREWFNYYFEGRKVLAKGGCRGEFEVCYLENVNETAFTFSEPAGQNCMLISLSSSRTSEGQRVITDVRGENITVRSMTLARQLSQTPCVLGSTFSFDGSKVVSRGGCIGMFETCYDERDVNYTAPEGEICDRDVPMLSYISQPDRYLFTNFGRRPLVIRAMILVKQISEINCVSEDSFFFVGATLHVTDGCKGVFRICYDYSDGQTVTPTLEPTTSATLEVTTPEPICQNLTLQATNNDSIVHTLITNYSKPLQVVSMELVKQLSTVHCLQWANYYYEGSTVLVKGGCSGQFEVCYLENVTLTPLIVNEPAGQTCRFISLFSSRWREGQRVITEVRGDNVTVRSMTLARQLSQTPCVLGSTFSFDGSKVVSRGGCIGTFAVCFDAREVNITAPEGAICDRDVVMFSFISHPDMYEFTTTDLSREPLTIRGMILVKQISEINCVLGETFFFAGSTLHARDGCKGNFKICYDVSGGKTATPTMGVPTIATVKVMPTMGVPTIATVKVMPTLGVPTIATVKVMPTLGVPTIATVKVMPTMGVPTIATVKVMPTMGVPTTATVKVMPTLGVPTTATVKVMPTLGVPTIATVKVMPTLGVPTIATVKVMPTLGVPTIATVKVMPTLGVPTTATVKVTPTLGVATTTPVKVTTTTPGADQRCETVKLMSRPMLPVKKTFIDSEGNPLPVVSVKLVHQISQTKCVEDDTFEIYKYGLRVFGGCKAIFQICVDSEVEELTTAVTTTEAEQKCETVKLMSRPMLPVKKTFIDSEGNPLPIVSVKLVHQISKTKCVEDDTFKVHPYALKVFGGCKAIFEVCVDSAVAELTTTATPKGEECMKLEMDSSKSNKLKTVKIVDRSSRRPVRITSVDVDKQMTGVWCEPGETYQYEDNSVSVTGGCGAVFNICYEKDDLPSPKEECMNVTLRSSIGKARAADMKDKHKNPVQIVSAKILTQFSHIPCILWETYSYTGGRLRASDGCSAVFKICYVKKSPLD